MEYAHILAAILAAFRLVTLFTADAIWQPIRERFPQIPWFCALCMSVWAGAIATVFLTTITWLNWPLAISWLYLAYNRSRKMDNAEIEARVQAMQAEYEMQAAAIMRRSSLLAAELNSAAQREKALRDELDKMKAEKGEANV